MSCNKCIVFLSWAMRRVWKTFMVLWHYEVTWAKMSYAVSEGENMAGIT